MSDRVSQFLPKDIFERPTPPTPFIELFGCNLDKLTLPSRARDPSPLRRDKRRRETSFSHKFSLFRRDDSDVRDKDTGHGQFELLLGYGPL